MQGISYFTVISGSEMQGGEPFVYHMEVWGLS